MLGSRPVLCSALAESLGLERAGKGVNAADGAEAKGNADKHGSEGIAESAHRRQQRNALLKKGNRKAPTPHERSRGKIHATEKECQL
jgi:hypothetical protein